MRRIGVAFAFVRSVRSLFRSSTLRFAPHFSSWPQQVGPTNHSFIRASHVAFGIRPFSSLAFLSLRLASRNPKARAICRNIGKTAPRLHSKKPNDSSNAAPTESGQLGGDERDDERGVRESQGRKSCKSNSRNKSPALHGSHESP